MQNLYKVYKNLEKSLSHMEFAVVSLSLSLVGGMLYNVYTLVSGGQVSLVSLPILGVSLVYNFGLIMLYSRKKALRRGHFSKRVWHFYSFISVAVWHSLLLTAAWCLPHWGVHISFTALIPSLILVVWHAVSLRMLFQFHLSLVFYFRFVS
jgi:hypothetical protein